VDGIISQKINIVKGFSKKNYFFSIAKDGGGIMPLNKT